MIEVPCRAKFKFSGCQKSYISKKWGFTKFNADEFEDMVVEKQLIHDGFRVMVPWASGEPCLPEGVFHYDALL